MPLKNAIGIRLRKRPMFFERKIMKVLSAPDSVAVPTSKLDYINDDGQTLALNDASASQPESVPAPGSAQDSAQDIAPEPVQVTSIRSAWHGTIVDFCRRLLLSKSCVRRGQPIATIPCRCHSISRWLEWCGSSFLAIYAIHWMFVPFVCAPIFNYFLPLHPSMLFKTACSLLAFLGILALTLPAAWLVENKMKWMVGRRYQLHDSFSESVRKSFYKTIR